LQPLEPSTAASTSTASATSAAVPGSGALILSGADGDRPPEAGLVCERIVDGDTLDAASGETLRVRV
jgi:hypothetical protein